MDLEKHDSEQYVFDLTVSSNFFLTMQLTYLV